ncbi:MAG: amidohydrolase family protein [bacterium]
MNRRAFLDTSARLVVAGALLPRFDRLGESRPSPFLDAHVHSASAAMLAYRASSSGRGATQPSGGPVTGAALVERLDADGVRRAFVMSTAYQMAADVNRTGPLSESEERARVALENDFVAEQCALFPDRLVPFLSVNPKRTYAIEEIDRCVEVHGMRGLKLHLWNSLVDTRKDADLSALTRVIAHAARRGLPVVAHIFVGAVPGYGGDDTERFVREVIAPLGTLKISIAHLAGAGGFATQQQQCFERLTALCGTGTSLTTRVWTDMAAIFSPRTSPADIARFAELVPQWGYDRLFWGSDSIAGALAEALTRWPLGDAAWQTIANDRGAAFCA